MAVLFGGEDGLPNDEGHIILVSGEPPGLRVCYILGADQGDEAAYALAVYDVDMDGYVDIAPNGMLGDGLNNTETDAGEIYVISGAAMASHLPPENS